MCELGNRISSFVMETGIVTGPENGESTLSFFYLGFFPPPLCLASCWEFGQSDARKTHGFSSRHNIHDGWVKEVRPQEGILRQLQDLKKSFCMLLEKEIQQTTKQKQKYFRGKKKAPVRTKKQILHNSGSSIPFAF